jgi:RimJ/RimL family protein N-acetyltransferase
MQVIAERKPAAFLARVGAYLAASPVENNLLAGIASSLEPEQAAQLLRVETDGVIELVAVQTPPRPLVLGRGGEGAAQRLAEHLAAAHALLPGVLGPRETVEVFVRAWSERSGAFGKLERVQTLYELQKLEPAPATPGFLRAARSEDAAMLARWSLAFQEEVGVFVGVAGDASSFVEAKVQAGQLYVWENGTAEPEAGQGPGRVTRPVCMAGWAARSPRAVRVNYVYTPPAERRKGYAGACVGALSKRLLDEGSEACLLFADAGNATSNGVYRRLGYRALCDFAQYEFVSR